MKKMKLFLQRKKKEKIKNKDYNKIIILNI